MKEFYLDYAATTPIDKRVLSFAKSFLEENFENPSSMHQYGIKTEKQLMKQEERLLMPLAPLQMRYISHQEALNQLIGQLKATL